MLNFMVVVVMLPFFWFIFSAVFVLFVCLFKVDADVCTQCSEVKYRSCKLRHILFVTMSPSKFRIL